MCGIVGYIGDRAAGPIVLDALAKLEYRGYDSAGIVVRDGTEPAYLHKSLGKLAALAEATHQGQDLVGTCGLGHTRWATHGNPSLANAHPHVSDDCPTSGIGCVESQVVGVHNGIIENFKELKDKLLKAGYHFYSETDSEVLIKLIDYYYKENKATARESLAKALVRVKGSYALAVIFKDLPGEIYIARKDSPLIVGVNAGETFISSDIPAILNHCRNVYYLENLEIARLTKGQAEFFTLYGDSLEKTASFIDWDAETAEKGNYKHFMLKEIHEQPQVIQDSLAAYVKEKSGSHYIDLSDLNLTEQAIRDFSDVSIVACGSAWHVGLAAEYIMEEFTDLPVRVELASEFRYRKRKLNPAGLVIVISQSGETADSLAALRLAKSKGLTTLGIVNVLGSSIAREADHLMHSMAGPEIAVATTKAYSSQLICCYLLALEFARLRGQLADKDKYLYYLEELLTLPQKARTILDQEESLQWLAIELSNVRDMFFIGRGLDYAIAMEGSLKMKEVSYIHSEAYAAGELKHGTIALLDEGTPVVGLLTQPDLYPKTLSNLLECKTRGAYLLALTSSTAHEDKEHFDYCFNLPQTDPHFLPSLAIIPLQLLGYYTSVSKGIDPDKPKNLAKSVTVE